jgi:glucosamine-6-phosphate deaminase
VEVLITKDAEQLADTAASIIRDLVAAKPRCTLGLATGSTPEKTYARLIRYHKEEGLDFSQISTFNLDEYLGLPPDHPQSYHFFMFDRLFSHININRNSVHIPSGIPREPEQHCKWYENLITRAGGIDLQLLGIGSDGHIGFNEPGSSLGSRTRIKTLARQTIEDNARLFFGEDNVRDVPRFAITMGVGTILDAKRLVLLASGERKAKIARQFIEGPLTSMVTASALQLHANATVILDEAAAAELEHKEYYNWVRDQKMVYRALKQRLAAG